MGPSCGRVGFREFDEDDLESYLEGSLWSERPCEAEAYGIHDGRIITVFPCTSSDHLNGIPYSALETIFTTRHPSSTQTYHDHSAQDTRSSYRNSRIDSKGVTVVSRPGSPGPVAGAGDVINTPHGFTIQLDVKLFRPEQIKIVLTEDLLCVSGERIEVGAGGQTLKRSFARKYCIPPDIHLDSVRSHLDHNGVLIINGSRRGWRETHINIHPHGYGDRRSNSLISTV
ncbi:Hsp20/alpha crystallin family protein [Necator americanus]|uniref:Hsp20/alpha crystallin family protein n=1 Tax=Necator americanus TaxID=51031 RepID=W2TWC2_NECAM|nr:Hsp20/alpha crystallin family protein [Necator americanus]ETN85302.1 Hsp20/alpha crystallin family protein [Necator americanus]